jgi:hypothetical protein
MNRKEVLLWHKKKAKEAEPKTSYGDAVCQSGNQLQAVERTRPICQFPAISCKFLPTLLQLTVPQLRPNIPADGHSLQACDVRSRMLLSPISIQSEGGPS